MTKRTLNLFKAVTQKYGLKLDRVKPYDSLYRKNSAFRATTDKGDFSIKAFYRNMLEPRLSTRKQIRRLLAYADKLKESGYPHIPSLLETASGRNWVHHNESYYYMMEWVDGRSLEFNEEDFANLGRALARLHTAFSADALPSMTLRTLKQMRYFINQDRLFRLRLARLRKLRDRGRWFREHGTECIRLAEGAWKVFRKADVKKIMEEEDNFPALVHGDVTHPNVVIREDGVFLIDWERLRMDSIYYEIAKTLLNNTNYQPHLTQAMLGGYEEINPLEPDQRRLIAAFYRLPREAWIAAADLLLRKERKVYRVLKETWDDRLKSIRQMDDWAEQQPPAQNSSPV